MRVQVEGIDSQLEFPDGTDIKIIQGTVKRLLAEKKADENSFMSKYLPSIKRTGEIYKEEVSSGLESMNKALEQPTGRNILGGALGAMQYGFSPLTAGVKGLIREPIQGAIESAGIPKRPASFIGDMVETAAYFVPYGKAVQTAIVGQKAMQEAKAVSQAAKTLGPTTSKPLKFPEGISDDVIKEATEPISAAHKRVLREKVVDDVVTKLKDPVGAAWDPTKKRITQEIVDYIVGNPSEIERIGNVYGLSPDQLAAQIKETMSISGRELGKMGMLAREIRKKFNTPYMQKLSNSIDNELADITSMDRFGSMFKTVENVRRAALVSQFATTMRNIISQGGRVTLGSVDDAFQGAANNFLKSGGEGAFKSVKSTLKGLGEGLDLFTAALHRLSPASRAKVVDILNTQNAIGAKAKMFTTPVQDVVLTGKISKALNYFNTTQEYFFRNIAFEAKLRQLTRKGGIKLKSLTASDIPEKMLNEAANYALDMTFASMPKSSFGKSWVQAMSHPIMTATLNPFPRFMYGNALPFLKRFSPIGFLEAASPKTVADIVSGNPEKFVKSMSEATLGTIMLNSALHIRNSEYGGEKWYEVKAGDKYIDTRAFAPFSTYLFLAEALSNPENIKPADFGSALLSLNRIGGTGLVVADMLRGETAKNMISPMKRFVGAYLSGFTVPARTVKDIYSKIDPEEAIIRDIKERELIGPTMNNIPGVSQMLPEAVSPMTTKRIKSETPMLRQFTGLSWRTKNELQKEVDRTQISLSRIYPRTGSALGDREVIKVMSGLLDIAYPILERQTNYYQMDKLTRKIILGQLFSEVKTSARKNIMKSNPELALKIKIDGIPQEWQDLLRSKNILR